MAPALKRGESIKDERHGPLSAVWYDVQSTGTPGQQSDRQQALPSGGDTAARLTAGLPPGQCQKQPPLPDRAHHNPAARFQARPFDVADILPNGPAEAAALICALALL
jgi:hypothetical protein